MAFCSLVVVSFHLDPRVADPPGGAGVELPSFSPEKMTDCFFLLNERKVKMGRSKRLLGAGCATVARRRPAPAPWGVPFQASARTPAPWPAHPQRCLPAGWAGLPGTPGNLWVVGMYSCGHWPTPRHPQGGGWFFGQTPRGGVDKKPLK